MYDHPYLVQRQAQEKVRAYRRDADRARLAAQAPRTPWAARLVRLARGIRGAAPRSAPGPEPAGRG